MIAYITFENVTATFEIIPEKEHNIPTLLIREPYILGATVDPLQLKFKEFPNSIWVIKERLIYLKFDCEVIKLILRKKSI